MRISLTTAFKPALLHWQLRQLRLVTAVAIPLAALWALLTPTPLSQPTATPMFFALFHSIALTVCLGRFRSPEFAFLHGRAFSRDALWAHTWLATLIAMLMVWMPAALIVWSGARSALLDKLQNPNYPILAPLDTPLPWHWLGWYALMLPILHYVWIRHLQPAKGANDGLWLAAGYILAMLLALGTLNPFTLACQPILWLAAAAFPTVSLALLLAGRRLYRHLEVRR